MKQIILTISMMTITLFNVYSQQSSVTTQEKTKGPVCCVANNMELTLRQYFDMFDTVSSENMEQKVKQANYLSMIAMKWDTSWLAHYYVAYSTAILSTIEKDREKRDAYLDQAEKELNEAISLFKNETDETYVLAAMITSDRIAINPADRAMDYSKKFNENIRNAKNINPNNPRIYYLKVKAKYGMPEFVGGGKKAALPYLERADSLYTKEIDTDISKPYWGKRENAFYLEQCKAVK